MTSRLLILNCSKNQYWSREFIGSFCWFLSKVKVPLSLIETPSISSLSGLPCLIELLCTFKAVGSVAAVSVTILNSSTFSAHLGLVPDGPPLAPRASSYCFLPPGAEIFLSMYRKFPLLVIFNLQICIVIKPYSTWQHCDVRAELWSIVYVQCKPCLNLCHINEDWILGRELFRHFIGN